MKLIWAFIICFLQSALFCSTQVDEEFVRGNHFFVTANYAKACQAYQNIEDKSFAVLYNLGLTYLNQGQRAQAMLYGKRAEKQANFKELTQLYNFFYYMHRQVDADYVLTWYEQLAIFLKKCILSTSMLLLQILLLIALFILILCWYQCWYPTDSKRTLSILFLYMLLIGSWWYKTHRVEQQVGIVTKSIAALFAGPDESFYQKAQLHESNELIILACKAGYYQVQTKQAIGWIHSSDIELV